MERGKGYFIGVIFLTVLVFVGAYYAFLPDKCGDYECFREHMVECKPSIYVNEEREASWQYEIIGQKAEQCEVQVTLLLAKEGELNLQDFEGDSMNCFYPLGTSGLPDEDLSICHGRLKEDLQQRIIEKLHEYILDNLGEIRSELGV